jgi:hypothetical protein
MGRFMSVGVVLLLGFGILSTPVSAQSGSGNRDRGFQLEQNFPNPFNPVTRIPFTLREELFEVGKPVVVTVRVYNVLRQLVAVPTALDHPSGNATPVEHLEYATPGRHVAYWDGLDRDGRKVASGIYFVLMWVNGEQGPPRKITVAK